MKINKIKWILTQTILLLVKNKKIDMNLNYTQIYAII